MPRLVKYAFSRSSEPTTWEVGPPWAHTTYGGSFPLGPTALGLAGGYTTACTVRPNFPSSCTCRGTGRYAGSGTSGASAQSTSTFPLVVSTRMSDGEVLGPAATPTTEEPSADRPESKTA